MSIDQARQDDAIVDVFDRTAGRNLTPGDNSVDLLARDHDRSVQHTPRRDDARLEAPSSAAFNRAFIDNRVLGIALPSHEAGYDSGGKPAGDFDLTKSAIVTAVLPIIPTESRGSG